MAFKWRFLVGLVAYVPVAALGMVTSALFDIALDNKPDEFWMAWYAGGFTFLLIHWVLWGNNAERPAKEGV